MPERPKVPAITVQQIHTKLIASASVALSWLVEHVTRNQADTVNRALQVYAFIEQKKAEGYEILIHKDGKTEVVNIV